MSSCRQADRHSQRADISQSNTVRQADIITQADLVRQTDTVNWQTKSVRLTLLYKGRLRLTQTDKVRRTTQ